MALRRRASNPLALAVMVLLYERPMHPYEMVSSMRERGKHEAIRLRYSSLYSVVESLERSGLISPLETVREGRRPERTVYSLTEAGRTECLDWLRDLLREPVKEYTQFAAGLSFVAALPPAEAATLLKERVRLLEKEVGRMRLRVRRLLGSGVARLFLVESEHELVLREAELGWVRGLVCEIETGTLDGMGQWKSFHAGTTPPAQKKTGREGG